METIGINEMKSTKVILEKKCANYFGGGTVDKTDVGFTCLQKQISIIDKFIAEDDASKTKVAVDPKTDSTPQPEVRVKRKYTKRAKTDSYGSYSGSFGATYRTYGGDYDR